MGLPSQHQLPSQALVVRENSVRPGARPLPRGVLASRLMRTLIVALLASLRAALLSRTALALENAALRQQLATYLRENAPAGTVPHLPGIRPLKACGSIPADFDERAMLDVVGHS